MKPAEIIDRIERITNRLYDRATYDRHTQDQLRQINKDIVRLRSLVNAER